METRSITVEISTDNEATSAPYWVIINPHQNMKCGDEGVRSIASCVKGLFMSREEAQNFLDRTHYNFRKDARVYCMSGCYGKEWVSAHRQHDRDKI